MSENSDSFIIVIAHLVSERGDSNARPLRPERSALPTALHSVTVFSAKIVQDKERTKYFKHFLCSCVFLVQNADKNRHISGFIYSRKAKIVK